MGTTMIKSKTNILVLDVHASEAGALSILTDFYEQVCDCKESRMEWTFVVSVADYAAKNNIKIKRYPWIKKSWLHRFLFEYLYLKRIIRACNPDIILNLQNKCVNVRDTTEIVYLHLPFILTDYNFKLFKAEFRLWFYQKIYKRFILKSYKSATKVIVQTKWMKNSLLSNTSLEPDLIEVIPPKLSKIFSPKGGYANSHRNINIFYPSTAFTYKNHIVILKAMKYFRTVYGRPISAQFTLSKAENSYSKKIYDYAVKNQIDVEFLGKVDRSLVRDKLMQTILVFPSWVESFGLPLLEARQLMTPIVSIDAPFSREILAGYTNAHFFSGNDHVHLAEQLNDLDRSPSGRDKSTTVKNEKQQSILDVVFGTHLEDIIES